MRRMTTPGQMKRWLKVSPRWRPDLGFKFLAVVLTMLFVLIAARPVGGQAPQPEWVRQFGSAFPGADWVQTVDADGNVYVGGRINGVFPGYVIVGQVDAFVRKYDANGNEVWTRQFGSTSYAEVRGLSADPTGVYVVGKVQGVLPGQTSEGWIDAFIRKYDTDGNELWTRQFGTSANSEDLAAGVSVGSTGVYVVGYVGGTAGSADAFVRKYDADGNELWTRQFGSPAFDSAAAVAVDSTGVYVAGNTGGALPGQVSAGGSDAFVRKYDADGNELWTRQLGSSDDDNVQGASADSSGVYVAGRTSGSLPGQTSAGYSDAFVLRLGVADGSLVWARQFGTPSWDQALGISVGSTGVYIVGSVWGALPGQTSTGSQDAFVRKYDADGIEVWTRQFGTSRGTQAIAVSIDFTGVYVAGNTDGSLPGQTSAGGSDVFIRKYDADGAEIWTRQFGSFGPGNDHTTAISSDGSVYVAGLTGGTLPGQTREEFDESTHAFVRKYDADGAEIWTRQFGPSSGGAVEAQGVSVGSTGVYIVGSVRGALPGQTNLGSPDAFIRKYDADGNELWTRQFGSSEGDLARAVAVDSTGVYVAGQTFGALPGQTGEGGRGAFMRKYDADGNELWTRQFGSSTGAQAVVVDPTGVYVAGDTGGALPGQASAGGWDAFVRKYDADGNEIWTRQFGSSAFDAATAVGIDSTSVYVAGNTDGALPGQASAGGSDVFVRKYDADGNEFWTRQFGRSSPFNGSIGIAVDSTGVYLAGATGDSLPGQTGAGGDDAFVRKYDADGNELWTYQFGTPQREEACRISVDSTGLYVAGSTLGVLPGQTSVGGKDAFVVKLAQMEGTESVSQEVNAGDTTTTDTEGDGATAADPVETAITSPNSGVVSIVEGPIAEPPSDGFSFLDQQVEVTAPATLAEDPLVLTFRLDASLIPPGQDELTIQAFKDGAQVPGCSGIPGSASPDPCISNRTMLPDGDVEITVLTSSASLWTFGVQTVSAISAPRDPVMVGTVMAGSAVYHAPGATGALSAVWDWGDGTTSQVALTEYSGTVSGSRTYTTPGVHTIVLTLYDEGGAVGSAAFQYVVVYDPNGGFVTGSGWIQSPAGAYTPDPSLSGKANFGFVSKYMKGAKLPTGQTEFQFKVADLNFHSDAYDWLVVAGAKAIYKGTGAVNGAGNYGFMLTAIDEALTPNTDVDLFRIKIWDKDNDDAIIYDNQLGASDDADPTTAIGGGNLVIHKQ